MINAIVYKTNTGHTKKYAQMLGEKIKLPVYDLDVAINTLTSHSNIIYLGWLMAGKIKGYRKANRHFKIKCLCVVGISNDDSQLLYIKKKNKLKDDLPTYILQGGFDINKLTGIYKIMMSTMKNTADKNKSETEKEMLDLMINGGNKVSLEKLTKVIDWYKKEGD